MIEYMLSLNVENSCVVAVNKHQKKLHLTVNYSNFANEQLLTNS